MPLWEKASCQARQWYDPVSAITPSRSQSTAWSLVSDMALILPDLIRLAGLVIGDKLLGRALGNDGAVPEAYPAFGLDELLAVPDDPGGNEQRLLDLNRLFEPDSNAGGQAGIAGGVGDIAHHLVQQAAQYAAVEEPRPSLIGPVRREFGSQPVAVPGKLELHSDGIVHAAPEAETFVEVSIQRDLGYGNHEYVSLLFRLFLNKMFPAGLIGANGVPGTVEEADLAGAAGGNLTDDGHRAGYFCRHLLDSLTATGKDQFVVLSPRQG